MTRLLVLGMLDIQPMSGYDIQLMLKLNDTERWAGVLIGSIYHALKKMEVDDAARIMSERQIRRLPIVDNNSLVGIVALGDISVEPTEQDNAEEALKNISQPGCDCSM